MRKRILWLGLSFILLAALVLTSCGPAAVEEEEAVVEEEEEAVVEEEEEAEEEAVMPAAGEVQYGGSLTVLTQRTMMLNPKGWRIPTDSWHTSPYSVPFYQNLISGDVSKGQTGTGEHTFGARYIPLEFTRGELAESWEVVQDPFRMIFHIRPGVYFQGKPGVMETRELVAADVINVWERRLTADPQYDPGKWTWIDRWEATDKYTVTLFLNWVDAEWFGALIGYASKSAIYPQEVVDADMADWRNACGTGPFMITNYIEDTLVAYSRNPNYWDTKTIDGEVYQLPFVDTLTYPIVVDAATQLAAVRTGKIDVWTKAQWVYTETLKKSNPELRWWQAADWGIFEIGMRTDTPPFDDLRVRRALSMAIDRQAICDGLYGGYGYVGGYYWGYNEPASIKTPWPEQPQAVQDTYSYNPEMARDLLDEAGIPPGAKFECVVASIPLEVDIVSLVKDYWADIDVELDIITMSIDDQYGVLVGNTHKHMLERETNNPTPVSGIKGDFSLQFGGRENPQRYDNPVLNDIIYAYLKEPDMAQQQAYMKQMNDVLLADCPTIFLPGVNIFRWAWPWVQNYEGETVTKYHSSINFWEQIWIDQVMKADMGY